METAASRAHTHGAPVSGEVSDALRLLSWWQKRNREPKTEQWNVATIYVPKLLKAKSRTLCVSVQHGRSTYPNSGHATLQQHLFGPFSIFHSQRNTKGSGARAIAWSYHANTVHVDPNILQSIVDRVYICMCLFQGSQKWLQLDVCV